MADLNRNPRPMRLPEIDWPGLLPALSTVKRERPAAFATVAELPVAIQFRREAAGEHGTWLVEQGLLEEASPGGRLRHTTSSRSMRVLLRAAEACEVVDADPGPELVSAIKGYLARNFTGAQRSVVLEGEAATGTRERKVLIASLGSVHWSRTFLALGDPAGFDATRGGRVYGEPMEMGAYVAACALVQQAVEGPISLPAEITPEAAAQVGPSIAAGIRYLMLFPYLQDGELTLGLMPHVRADLLGGSPTRPETIPGGLPPPRASHVEDTEGVFVHACTSPIRIKAGNNELYQRDMDQLVAGLPKAPTRVEPEQRVVNAVNVLVTLGALEVGKNASSRRCLNSTTEGSDWLSKTQAERFEGFLDGVREPSATIRMHRLHLADGYHYLSDDQAVAQWEALLRVYQDLPRDGGVPVEPLVAYCARHENPLARDDLAASPWLIDSWEEVLDRFFDWLGSLGGVVFARRGEVLVVGACAMGDYVLGLRAEPPVVEASDVRVIVQPNFDIVFLDPALAAEVSLARFCDRTDQGHVGTLLKITQAAVLRAGAAGLTLEAIESALHEHTDSVPANVRHEIATWHQRVRRVKATSGIVVECPDTETADRMEAESKGRAFTRLGPTVLMAIDRKSFDRVTRALAVKGIVIDLDLAADPVVRKKTPRRRRRYW